MYFEQRARIRVLGGLLDGFQRETVDAANHGVSVSQCVASAIPFTVAVLSGGIGETGRARLWAIDD